MIVTDYPSKRGAVEVCRTHGRASKVEIFQELIWKVCGAKVKLTEAPQHQTTERSYHNGILGFPKA